MHPQRTTFAPHKRVQGNNARYLWSRFLKLRSCLDDERDEKWACAHCENEGTLCISSDIDYTRALIRPLRPNSPRTGAPGELSFYLFDERRRISSVTSSKGSKRGSRIHPRCIPTCFLRSAASGETYARQGFGRKSHSDHVVVDIY